MLFQLTALISSLILALYIHFRRRYNYWKALGVPFIEPTFPTGNVAAFLGTAVHFSYVIEKLYKQLKHHDCGYAGIYFFGNPVFLVTSPEMAKTVLIRDFQYFMDRGIYFNGDVDVLSANIFFLRGHKWKALREKLSPTFSSGKLKQMFVTMLDVGQRLVDHLQPLAAADGDVEIRDLMARFMTDVIASCAFGLQTDCLNERASRFRQMGRRMINFPKSKALKLIIASTFQRQAHRLGIRWNDKDVTAFFTNVVRETIHYRETSGERRQDFMQLLIDLKTSDGDGSSSSLTFDEIAAQAFVFFFAGELSFMSINVCL